MKKIILLFFCFGMGNIYSQGGQEPSLPSVIGLTPNVAELGKYGVYPVSMNTGIPDIKFPLFRVNVNEISLPFSLSYHAGGIKVNQEATEVGLGWSILGAGVIHRNVLGVPDESSEGNFNAVPLSTNDYTTKLGGTGQQKDDNHFYLQTMARGAGKDSQADLFSYTIAGKSGKFIYGRDREYMTMPHEPIKIEREVSGVNYFFKITDEKGTEFHFRDMNKIMIDNDPTYRKHYISDWHLSHIVSNIKKDTIHFTYETAGYTKVQESHSVSIGRSLTQNGSGTEAVPIQPEISTSTSEVAQEALRLKRIISKNGEVVFNYGTVRLDGSFDSNAKLLDDISVYNMNNVLIKKIEFDYDYFLANFSSFQNHPSFRRLKLKGFSELATDQSGDRKEYTFEYENSIPIPKVGDFSQDYWGFFNGAYNGGTLIPVTTISGTEITLDGMTISDKNTTWNIGTADRSVDTTKMQMAILKRITYPTQGYTTFQYEPHAYLSDLGSSQTLTYGGGLRIAAIKNYAANNQLATTETYAYGVGENGLGDKLFDEELFFKNYDDTTQEGFLQGYGSACTGNVIAWQRRYMGVESYSAMNYSGIPVVYKEVNKYVGNNTSTTQRSKYEYELLSDPRAISEDFINSGNYGARNVIWNQPNLLYETHYKRNGSTFDSIQRIEYTHQSFYNKQDYGIMLKEQRTFTDHSLIPGCFYTYGTGPEPLYIIAAPFPYKSRAYRMKQKKEISYLQDPSNPLETLTDYFYDNPEHMQPTRTESIDSKGDLLKTMTEYPLDINNPTVAEQNLITRHRLAVPLKTETHIKNGTGPKELLATQYTNYKDWDNDLGLPTATDIILPEVVETSKESQALENRITYHSYYSNGNIREVSKADGPSIYYIWGYNEQYPIAKIENFKGSQITTTVQNLINAAVTASDNDDSPSTENNLRTALANLRNTTALSNAMVTTYTYDPLVGVTSITDPKGNTVYYEYDGFNRLKSVRDRNNNLITDHRYKYKDQ